MVRVRTILAFGRYSQILDGIAIGGDIFLRCDTQYDTDQTAVDTIHMIKREWIECKLYIIIIIQF